MFNNWRKKAVQNYLRKSKTGSHQKSRNNTLFETTASYLFGQSLVCNSLRIFKLPQISGYSSQYLNRSQDSPTASYQARNSDQLMRRKIHRAKKIMLYLLAIHFFLGSQLILIALSFICLSHNLKELRISTTESPQENKAKTILGFFEVQVLSFSPL